MNKSQPICVGSTKPTYFYGISKTKFTICRQKVHNLHKLPQSRNAQVWRKLANKWLFLST